MDTVNVLYELQFEIGIFHIGILIFSLIFVTELIYRYKTEKKISVFYSFWSALTLLVLIAIPTNYFAAKEDYRNGQYETVTGYVENFYSGHYNEHDVFTINNVEFRYSSAHIVTGYHKDKRSGGVIIGDGQYLEIHYIEKKDNRTIVYIAEFPDLSILS